MRVREGAAKGREGGGIDILGVETESKQVSLSWGRVVVSRTRRGQPSLLKGRQEIDLIMQIPGGTRGGHEGAAR